MWDCSEKIDGATSAFDFSISQAFGGTSSSSIHFGIADSTETLIKTQNNT